MSSSTLILGSCRPTQLCWVVRIVRPFFFHLGRQQGSCEVLPQLSHPTVTQFSLSGSVRSWVRAGPVAQRLKSSRVGPLRPCLVWEGGWSGHAISPKVSAQVKTIPWCISYALFLGLRRYGFLRGADLYLRQLRHHPAKPRAGIPPPNLI